MPLAPGARVGVYEILGPLGAGGMGEVYRARDARLNRDVAVKVLPALFATDTDRLARFERESQALAALNHPNIAQVHGYVDGPPPAIVMEFVEGEDLAERLKRGLIPADEALPIARQIAEALEAAHARGIVHRDLKPANIKVRADGTVKVLDFGLAKALEVPSGPIPGALENSPTFTAPAVAGQRGTELGVILGTAAYMAPEQAKGKAVDKRADVWAFGVVLYEMLIGRSPFAGETISDVIAAVLTRDPDLSALPPGTPPSVRRLLERCLQRDPKKRLRDAGDAILEIDAAGEAARPVLHDRPSRTRVLGPLAAATAAAAGTAALMWLLLRPAPPTPLPVIRAEVPLGPGVQFNMLTPGSLALSRDGTWLAYAALRGQNRQIFLQRLDETVARPVPGSDGGVMPFFSPDAQWLGFRVGRALMKAPVGGGPAVRIVEHLPEFGAVWMEDGTIVFASVPEHGLFRVPADGGEVTPVSNRDPGELSYRWPDVLPGGRAIIYAALGSSRNPGESRIVLQPLDGGPRTVLVQGATGARYLRSGHLLFSRARSLFVVPFDATTQTVSGTPQLVADGLAITGGQDVAVFAASDSGVLAAVQSVGEPQKRTLAWVTLEGKSQPLPVSARAFEVPRISPDGRYASVTIREDDADIWLLDLERSTLTRFTSERGEDESAVWTPDSRRLTFSAARDDQRQTRWRPIDRSAPEEVLFTTPRHQHLGGWTPDGKTLVTEETGPVGWDIFTGSLDTRTLTPVSEDRFLKVAVQPSPDGRWIAYASNDSGVNQVYVQPLRGPGGRVQISTGGGTEPRWAPDGRTLYFRNVDRMMAVPIRTDESVQAGAPRELFTRALARVNWEQANYDVAPDGRRFLVVEGTTEVLPTRIRLVANWKPR